MSESEIILLKCEMPKLASTFVEVGSSPESNPAEESYTEARSSRSEPRTNSDDASDIQLLRFIYTDTNDEQQ